MRLALALHKSLAEVEGMSNRELTTWRIYDQKVRILPDVQWQIASLEATTVNLQVANKKDRIDVDVPLPKWEESKPKRKPR